MAVFETWLRSDLKRPMRVVELSGNLFSADNGGNLIGVEVLDGGQAASLSGNVYGYVIRADGGTVLIDGTLSGNRASIVLPASAYVVIGQVSIVIKVGAVTVGACVAQVYRTTTDTIVDPANVIPSISELLEAIDDCEQATADANSAATLANTKAGLADEKATLADQKATLANTAAGTANTAAAAANTAALKIDNMTVAASSSATPTATITEVEGHKHIAFGLVQGNPGKDFHIQKTFASIAAMQAYDPDLDPSASKVTPNDFVMIDTGSVQDADTGKLFCYEPETQDIWRYIGDLSGSQGIKGETGTGIANIVLNADYTLTITMDDGSTSYTTGSIRGAQGAQGPIGPAAYVHIRYSAVQPTQDSDMSTTPNDWMGIYSGAASTAPTAYTDYVWYKIKGETGSVSNMYGTTIPMSEQDSTKIATAIGNKLDANQGSANAGKFMRVGSTGAVAYDDPTERYASESNFPATGDAGKLYIAENTGKIYVWDGTNTEYVTVGGSESQIYYGTSSSGSSDAEKAVTVSESFYAASDIPAGTVLYVNFTNQNTRTYALKLNINSGGGIYVSTMDGGDGNAFRWNAGEWVQFVFLNSGWKVIRNGAMQGATFSHSGKEGSVPAPSYGDEAKFLRGDGTWANPAVMTGAGSLADGASGFVPKPFAGYQTKVLKASGTWTEICLKGSLTAISAAGTISNIALAGLTADFKVCNWGLFSDALATTPISPTEAPADITITEKTDAYDITIANYSSAFYIQPTFVLPMNMN